MLALEFGKFPVLQVIDLERSDGAPQIVWMNLDSGLGIDLYEFGI
jgi:hypothetical protein